MTKSTARALVVHAREDDALARALAAHGVSADRFQGSPATPDLAESGPFDLVVLDLEMAGGRELVSGHAERFPDVPLIALAPAGDPAAGVEAVRSGAAEWVSRPLDPGELGPALERALARARRAAEKPAPPRMRSNELLGVSPAIEKVRDLVDRIAIGDSTVLIRGETGTGKELVARSIHERSTRRSGPFVKTHVAALPDALLESELFGYEKGAFTGASTRKPGRVELAQGGTLFLDEIGEVSLGMQSKLLRLVQDHEYERLGGTRSIDANVRFVAATHRDLEDMVEQGSFREDLFYRLNVVSVWLPPLRARREDIPLIAQAYAGRLAEHGARAIELDESALAVLRSQRWPGNVRQLLNLVERLVVLATGPVIRAADVDREMEEQVSFATQSAEGVLGRLPDALGEPAPTEVALPLEPRRSGEPSIEEPAPSTLRPLREELRRAESRALKKALASAKGNRSLAARLLGVSRRTLYTKLEEHGLE
jgi:two-component system response regulator AtoC